MFTSTARAPARDGWEANLDRVGVWVAVSIALIAIAYGPFLVGYLPPKLWSKPFTMF